MEHVGLVARVEADLERSIALGRCPRGMLPSERVMAQRYGVSRTTIRGALQRLASRGLIVQHPGRQSRTVALDQALTLESLKLVLPEEGRPDESRRRLLEGFFALKREVTVELLATCCESASKEDLGELGGACFALREETHWREDRRAWVRQEFALLRMAARAADRPGHALLVQSLEKAFRGLADRILPYLDAGAIEQWALFAFGALHDRDAQMVRRELPALLQAVDARLVDPLAPSGASPTPPTPSPASEPSPLPEEEALSGANGPNRYACHTSSEPARPTEGLSPQEVPPTLALTAGCSAPGDGPGAWAASDGEGSCGDVGRTAAPIHSSPGGAESLGVPDTALPQAECPLEGGILPPRPEHPFQQESEVPGG